MIWHWLKGNRSNPAEALYLGTVSAARRPKFYAEWGVPDTVDGRFEMLSLHMFLLLDRLKDAGPKASDVGQELADTFFSDMDRSLREMGVGDLSVGKKVRKMAEAFYGRAKAYGDAIDKDGGEWEQALSRNIFPDMAAGKVDDLASWARDTRKALRHVPDDTILTGKLEWP